MFCTHIDSQILNTRMLWKISSVLLAATLSYGSIILTTTADGILPSNIVGASKNVSVKIMNVATMNPVITFSNNPVLEVLVGQGASPPGDLGVWDRGELGADSYVFTNRGTGQKISVNDGNDHLVTSIDVPATVFAVEAAGQGEFVIKLPYADSVWVAIFDGTSPIFGRIALRPASGSAFQRWTFA